MQSVGERDLLFCYSVKSEKKRGGDSSFPATVQSRRAAMPGTLSVLFAISEWTAIQVFFSLTQLRVFLHTNKPNGPG